VFRYATSLAARHGTLWVARWNRTWRVTPHDFDGRELAPGFVVRPEGTARVTIASIAVDEDRRVWIADTGSERVRAFTAFGRELEGLPRGASDRAGSLAGPIAIDSEGVEEEARIVVASIGVRRNALHVVRADGRASVSLRPRDADVGFSGLGRVAFGPRGLVLACEPASGLVLVWRDGQFHFAFRAPDGRVPVAVRALGDGRSIVRARMRTAALSTSSMPRGVRSALSRVAERIQTIWATPRISPSSNRSVRIGARASSSRIPPARASRCGTSKAIRTERSSPRRIAPLGNRDRAQSDDRRDRPRDEHRAAPRRAPR